MIGGIDCIQANFDIKIMPPLLPNFYKEVLQAWADIYQTLPTDFPSILLQPIWNNKYIKINNHPIFFKYIYSKGFMFVGDLLSEGKIISFEEAVRKGVDKKYFLHWFGIINAIPREWKNNISLQLQEYYFERPFPKLHVNGKEYDLENLKQSKRISFSRTRILLNQLPKGK